ncbi:hypothetical protein ACF1G5_39935 [Streptomyces coeruleorubidus]|uniref:hypothetical protein n=1 Tax=Streptomyces coeruleorubidus TaxID=116188 RepID=UPI003701CC7F
MKAYTPRRKSYLATGALSTFAVLMTVLAPASSAAEKVADPADPAVQAAIKRTLEGGWTQADINLIMTNPDLAAALPDPRKEPTVVVKEAELTDGGQLVSPAHGEPLSAQELADLTPPADADSSSGDAVTTPAETESAARSTFGIQITGGKWRKTHVIRTHYSYSNSVIYKYHHWAEFNYKDGKVRAWRYRADDVTNALDFIEVKERQKNEKSAVPASSATSYMKRKIGHCFVGQIACAHTYPWVKTKVRGNGKVTFSTGS